MGRLERDYQPKLIARLKKEFPGCMVLKNDSGYIQGIPDWTIFYKRHWATLEIKRKKPTRESDFEPNQEHYIQRMNAMSSSYCVYPENEDEVIDALRKAFTSRW